MAFTKDDSGKPRFDLITDQFKQHTIGRYSAAEHLFMLSQYVVNDISVITRLNGEMVQFCTAQSISEWEYLNYTAQALTLGAEKYGEGNWKLCDDPMRFANALSRHIVALNSGEKYAEDTGVHHIGHIGANVMFLMHFNSLLQKDKKCDRMESL